MYVDVHLHAHTPLLIRCGVLSLSRLILSAFLITPLIYENLSTNERESEKALEREIRSKTTKECPLLRCLPYPLYFHILGGRYRLPSVVQTDRMCMYVYVYVIRLSLHTPRIRTSPKLPILSVLTTDSSLGKTKVFWA